jgi:tRNA A37 N6-isopentenylltransferase MiaA
MLKYGMDIVILGPSNSGKTYFANYLASVWDFPIFNCDSVQIYKYLNSLTSKPEFEGQTLLENEIISSSLKSNSFNFDKYTNINVDLYFNLDGNLQKHSNLNSIKTLEKLQGLQPVSNSSTSTKITNYIFDIKEPGESYSTIDFEKDLNRITKKFDIKNKIITGGTIYYAYNYLFRINNLEGSENYKINKFQDSKYELQDMVLKLENLDPESLSFIDIKNPRRVQSALDFIQRTGKKYSENYKKELSLRNNFILINLWPKNREEYYKSLDKIIEERFNGKTFEELDFLIKKYGEEIIPWLERVSYEYRYFLRIFLQMQKNSQKSPHNFPKIPEIQAILQELKYKEHQYTKKQMTFMHRLEREIEKYV